MSPQSTVLTGTDLAKSLDLYDHDCDDAKINRLIDEAEQIDDRPSADRQGTTGEIALLAFAERLLSPEFKCNSAQVQMHCEAYADLNITPLSNYDPITGRITAQHFTRARIADLITDVIRSTPAHDSRDASASGDVSGRASLLRVKGVQELTVNTKLLRLVQGLLGYMQLIIAYGASGSGKSFVLLYMALCIVTGRDWYGRKVTRGPVVYLALEGAGGFGNRVHAWIKHHNADADDLRGFGLIDGSIDLLRPGKPTDAHVIVEQIRAFEQTVGERVVLVILDTLSQATPGADENAAKDMTRALERMKYISDTLGASVVAIHHEGKDASKGMRGFSGLRGNIDAALNIRDGEITTAKMRDGDDKQLFRFRLEQVDIGIDDEGATIQSCVALPSTSTAPRVEPLKRGSQSEIAFNWLVELCNVDQPASIFGTGVSEIAWRERCKSGTLASGEPEAERKAFQRVRRDLMSRGYVSITADKQVLIAAGQSGTKRDMSLGVRWDGQGHTPIGVSCVPHPQSGLNAND